MGSVFFIEWRGDFHFVAKKLVENKKPHVFFHLWNTRYGYLVVAFNSTESPDILEAIEATGVEFRAYQNLEVALRAIPSSKWLSTGYSAEKYLETYG